MCVVCEYYAERAAAHLQDDRIGTEPGAETYVAYEPLGTVLAVMPWNYLTQAESPAKPKPSRLRPKTCPWSSVQTLQRYQKDSIICYAERMQSRYCCQIESKDMVLELSNSLLGVFLAVVGSVGFAGQFLCIRLGTDSGEVSDAVLVVLLSNVFLILPAVLLFHRPPYVELFTPLAAASFAAAGIAGMFVARILMFRSIKRLGANLTSPVIASNALFATIFAVVFLGERPTISQYAGIVLIVVGIAFVSWETATADNTTQSVRQTGGALVVPVAAAVCIGIEPIFVSIGLAEGTPVLPGLFVMASSATVSYIVYLGVTGSIRRIPLRSVSTAWYVGGGVSTTIGFTAYFAALEVAPVALVMPLLQLTPLLVVGFSVLFLPQRLERVTWRVTASAVVVVVGATVVSLQG